MNKEDALIYAVNRIKKLPKNTQFTLKELFENDWENVYSVTEFGKVFKTYVLKEGKSISVKFTDKKSNNHSVYKKF